jgi:HK97 family phage portal protein
MANLLSRLWPSKVKSVEGQYRDGPWWLPVTGGWLSSDVGSNWNWWQMGNDPLSGPGCSAMVEACIGAYSQTIAMCPGDHWKRNDKGGRDRVSTSALSRILRKPNDYQSISDFMLNTTRSLYNDGETFALALRNDRFEINELHLMRSRLCAPLIATTGDVFYSLAGNEIISQRFGGEGLIVPARDVLHIRLHTPNHPLKGVTPLLAVACDIAASGAMTRQQLAFYNNQARPSTVLSTDMVLTKEQVDALRERWNEQSKGINAGGTPILTAGLKPQQLAASARDSQFSEVMKMTDQNIALAFRVPLQILGIGGTPYASTELLMQSWIASGLGFAINHIEEAFGQLFGLKGLPDEYLEFDTAALLRSALKDRIESYAAGTRAGIFAPNEARAQFELEKVKDGDEPRMQQQDVPLSYGAQLDPTPPKPAPAPAAPPAEPAAKPAPSDKEIANDNERLRQSFRASHARHVAV